MDLKIKFLFYDHIFVSKVKILVESRGLQVNSLATLDNLDCCTVLSAVFLKFSFI